MEEISLSLDSPVENRLEITESIVNLERFEDKNDGIMTEEERNAKLAFHACQAFWPKPGDSDAKVEKRIEFLNGTYVTPCGKKVGLPQVSASVQRLEVHSSNDLSSTQPLVCLVSRRGSVAFSYHISCLILYKYILI